MSPTHKGPKRIRHACSRCRRQKLRCDQERPCHLCVRVGAECTEATERTWRSNRPNSVAYKSRHAALQRSEARPGRPAPSTSRSPVSPRHGSPTTSVSEADRGHGPSADSSASVLHLVDEIFKKYRVSSTGMAQPLDAIPASDSSGGTTSPRDYSHPVPVKEILAIDLPPADLVETLLDSYRDSFHWYLTVVHEPSLRARLRPVVESGLASRQQRPLLLLALMILVIGARCLPEAKREETFNGLSITKIAAKLFEAAERWFSPSMNSITVDTVAYSFLLAMYYMWIRQTKAAFITMNTTIRAAKSIGLDRESSWGDICAVEREFRRRAWWATFVGAGFISICWGVPPVLGETDYNVRQPLDVEDLACQCPGFDSLELREDGELSPVTIGSYNRYKAELYKIGVTIMRDVYFTRHRETDTLHGLISRLHQRLWRWEQSIPPELRVESHPPVGADTGPDGLRRPIFAIQALTLRVSYDSMQMLLFRPLVSRSSGIDSQGSVRGSFSISSATSTSSEKLSRLLQMAQHQCWTSATRTSRITQRPDLLDSFLFAVPAIHTGVHAFAAGVVLALLALSEPLSARGQEGKRDLARIIRIPKTTKLRSHVWSQMTEVLTDLLRVVAAEETAALLSGSGRLDLGEAPPRLDTFGAPTIQYEAPEAEDCIDSQRDGLQDELASPCGPEVPTGPIARAATTDGAVDLPTPGAPRDGTGETSLQPTADAPDNTTAGMEELWNSYQVAYPLDFMLGMDQAWFWDTASPYSSKEG